MRSWCLVGALVLALAAAAGGRAQLERSLDREPRESELLYLPNGKHLKVASLGHATLVADALYLWAIQFYANYERADRYEYVEHIFGDVIAELDPHYVDAYWLGALILIVEAHDLDRGLRLLDKGIAANPRSWILPYLAGWECHGARRYRQAAHYFELAAAVPDAPAFAHRMRAGMHEKSGDLELALRRWREVLEDPGSQRAARHIAAWQVRKLQVRIDLDELTRAIRAFRDRTGRWPDELGQLQRVGLIHAVPRDPDGEPYRYSPATGEIAPPALGLIGER